MNKALYCEYCKRFCDERCLKCIYMKEAKLKEKEDKEDEKKMESKESEEGQSSRSGRAFNAPDSVRRLLSTADIDEFTTLKAWIDQEHIDRYGLEDFVNFFFATVFANLETADPKPIADIGSKLLKLINEEGGK